MFRLSLGRRRSTIDFRVVLFVVAVVVVLYRERGVSCIRRTIYHIPVDFAVEVASRFLAQHSDVRVRRRALAVLQRGRIQGDWRRDDVLLNRLTVRRDRMRKRRSEGDWWRRYRRRRLLGRVQTYQLLHLEVVQ